MRPAGGKHNLTMVPMFIALCQWRLFVLLCSFIRFISYLLYVNTLMACFGLVLLMLHFVSVC